MYHTFFYLFGYFSGFPFLSSLLSPPTPRFCPMSPSFLVYHSSPHLSILSIYLLVSHLSFLTVSPSLPWSLSLSLSLTHTHIIIIMDFRIM